MKVKSNKKERVLAPEGVHNARCYRVIDLGTQTSHYEGKEIKSRKVMLGFELVDESYVFDEEKGEENFTLSRDLTMSLNPKSTLSKMITAWTGTKFGKDAEYDLTELLGKPCQIQVVHNETSSGEIYANIGTVMMSAKGAKVSPLTQTKTILSLEPEEFDQDVYSDLPEWLQEKIAKSPEYAGLFASPAPDEEEEEEVAAPKSKAKPKAKGKKKMPF